MAAGLLFMGIALTICSVILLIIVRRDLSDENINESEKK